jgi:hypothetical protein
MGVFRETFAIGIFAMICAAPAHACVSASLETYVLLASLPAPLPKGALSVKVWVSLQAANTAEAKGGLVEAEVRDATSVGDADRIYIDPGQWSSCSRWGLLNADAYVVGFMTRLPSGKIVLRAVQMEPFVDRDRYRISPALRAKTS